MRLFKIAFYTIVISLTLWGCSSTGPDEGQPTEYNLSVSANPSEGGSVDPAGGTYEEGTEVTIEATANDGWSFDGWSGDEESNENPLTITINSDTEITANFSEGEPTEYNLSVSKSPSEGGSVEPTDSTYEQGTEVTVEAVPNDGWNFSGWTGDRESDENPLTFTIEEDVELTANFSEEPPSEYDLTVSANPTDGGSVDPSNGSYTEGTEVTVEATPNDGWEFTGWQGDMQTDENPLTFTIDSNTQLTATFAKKEYEVTVSADPSQGGSVSPSSQTVKYGTQVTVEATPSENWEFSGWSGDMQSDSNPFTFTVNSNTNLTANFTQKPKYDLSVSANPSEGGSVDPSSGSYFEGTKVTVEAIPSSGWRFTGWSGDINFQNSTVEIEMTSDTDMTANFEEKARAYSNQIEVTNGSYSESLTFGMDENATAGFDNGLDEESPPPPPQGSFYANFKIDNYDLFKDYRPVTQQETVWEINFGMGESSSVTLNWDFSSSNHAGDLTLVDDIDNPSIEVDMSAQDSYQVTDGSVDELYIIQE